jgi:hypothetical protein
MDSNTVYDLFKRETKNNKKGNKNNKKEIQPKAIPYIKSAYAGGASPSIGLSVYFC